MRACSKLNRESRYAFDVGSLRHFCMHLCRVSQYWSLLKNALIMISAYWDGISKSYLFPCSSSESEEIWSHLSKSASDSNFLFCRLSLTYFSKPAWDSRCKRASSMALSPYFVHPFELKFYACYIRSTASLYSYETVGLFLVFAFFLFSCLSSTSIHSVPPIADRIPNRAS